MKYGVIKCVNGNYEIDSEWNANLNGAKVKFHDLCRILWNSSDVLSAYIMIVDEQLDVVEGYKEYIHHDPTPSVEPEPEPEA